jgi:uncharacterized protein (DUF433 family)
MTFHDKIEINAQICSGKPVIKGTRIVVSILIGQLAAGQSFEDLKRGYPGLTDDEIRAALEYAAVTMDKSELEELQ